MKVSQQGAEMLVWIGFGMAMLGIGYYIAANWLLAKHRQERQKWIDEIRSHSTAWDEFAATWKYGAHEEAIDGMCRFLATCTRPENGTHCPEHAEGKNHAR
jgi:hypothetical protein